MVVVANKMMSTPVRSINLYVHRILQRIDKILKKSGVLKNLKAPKLKVTYSVLRMTRSKRGSESYCFGHPSILMMINITVIFNSFRFITHNILSSLKSTEMVYFS